VVEVGAGAATGPRSSGRGVEVHAYDPAPGKTAWSKKVWTEVRRGWTKPASDHPDATLFLCWPSYTSGFARIALNATCWRAAAARLHRGARRWMLCR